MVDAVQDSGYPYGFCVLFLDGLKYIVYRINKKRTLASVIKQRTPAFRDQAVNLQTLPKSYATRQQRIVTRGGGGGEGELPRKSLYKLQ